ncbi:MAG TPA: amidohydrolase [Trueperaceae bacterium]
MSVTAHADAIFLGSVLTMDPSRPREGGVAVRGGRVLALGSPSELHELAGPETEVFELGGACLMPGFHDSHVHLTQHGLELSRLDLAPARTFDDALDLLRRHAADLGAGELLRATGMALNTWGLRTIGRGEADALEEAVGGRPALVASQDHHSAWASAALLARAGVGEGTPDPADGVVVRDEGGRPTGLLLEAARRLVADAVPAPGRDELRRALAAAGESLAARGVTTVHHMAAEPAGYFRELALAASDDAYPLRVWACVPQEQLEAAAEVGLATGQGGRNFQVGGAKFFADGALGSKTAWMLEPYAGTADVGMAVDGPEVLAERVPLAVRAGLAPVVHAIGDAAVRAVLDAFEASAAELEAAGLRPRLEHAQHVHPSDLPRFRRLGVVASVQPIHLTFDAGAIGTLLADRVERAYPLRSLARSGARLAFGSDTPVASPDVPTGLRAACRRLGLGGERLNPAEAVSPDEALLAYTAGAAYAIGWESRSGRLAVGYDADMVVLSHDPLVSLDGLAVVATVKGGVFTYGEL